MENKKSHIEIDYKDWTFEAIERYGQTSNDWKFICPLCKHVASIKDWREQNSEGMAAFSCIGRTLEKPREAFGKGKGPCNYAGGGLFTMNPIHVKMETGDIRQTFDFADKPLFKELE